MSFSFISKIIFFIIFLFALTACNSEKVFEKIKVKKYEAPQIQNYDENKISFKKVRSKNIDINNKVVLKKFKNNNQYLKNVLITNNEIYAIDNNKLLNFSYETGDLVSTKILNLEISTNDIIVSFKYIENSFLIALKSGSIFRINMNGEIIWHYKLNKLLNTNIKIFNEQIIALYSDEIKSILLNDGTELWSENFDDLPVYQAKGGQLSNFYNIIYFILPNNKVGSIDLNLGSIHTSKFDELPLLSSINNTKDKINLFDNYLIYLDEGKYLYTLDIFSDDFILYKETINSSESNFLFNNSIILKEGDYIQAINSKNLKTFWLINDKTISKNSDIISVRNYNDDIEIFLDNGDIITISDKKLIGIRNLNVGKILKITFEYNDIIVHTKSSKTVIF